MFISWGGFNPPEKPTEYEPYRAAGTPYVEAFWVMENSMLPPSFEVFFYGYGKWVKSQGMSVMPAKYAETLVINYRREDGA